MPDTHGPHEGNPALARPQPTGNRVEREFTAKERSQLQLAYRRFLRHRLAAISVVIFVLLGDGLRDALDPRQTRPRR